MLSWSSAHREDLLDIVLDVDRHLNQSRWKGPLSHNKTLQIATLFVLALLWWHWTTRAIHPSDLRLLGCVASRAARAHKALHANGWHAMER
eukprot:6466468-Amphidinium_carterae.1